MSDLVSRLRALGDRAYTSPVAWIDGDVGDLAHEAADALEAQDGARILTEFRGNGVWRDQDGAIWVRQSEAAEAVKTAMGMRGD